ncbi:MAG: thioredoxin family protein [Flavobacteriales bacterium]|nr:thioredoxin family protein [Flavobacteriales bacterium]
MAVEVVTDNNFQTAIGAHERVIVKYYADWCGSCKLFAPKFRRLSEDERFKEIAFIDVNAEENPEARKVAGVDNLPFFATFYKGKLVTGQATSKEEQVVAMLEQLKSL